MSKADKLQLYFMLGGIVGLLCLIAKTLLEILERIPK